MFFNLWSWTGRLFHDNQKIHCASSLGLKQNFISWSIFGSIFSLRNTQLKKMKNIFERFFRKSRAVAFIKQLEMKDFKVELVICVGSKLGKETHPANLLRYLLVSLHLSLELLHLLLQLPPLTNGHLKVRQIPT